MKIGILCGREYSFPPAFIDKVNELGKKDGISAEFVKLGGTVMGELAQYKVIVDRISHEVEYYRAYLKHAVLQGTYVINNPFWWTADDKFSTMRSLRNWVWPFRRRLCCRRNPIRPRWTSIPNRCAI
jgi:hypothetical protein